MRRFARTVAAGFVVILGLALVGVSAVGDDGGPLGRPSVPEDRQVQSVPPVTTEDATKAALPISVRPNSFDSEFGKRGKHDVEVRVTGGAIWVITFRDDKEGEWGSGSATRSRTINSGFPVVQVGMSSASGGHSTCTITIDGEEKDTQSTSAAKPVNFCEA
jgi:hypothetical protein